MAWLFGNIANFGDEAGVMIFGLILWAGIFYVGIDNYILEPRRKKREHDRLHEMIKAHRERNAGPLSAKTETLAGKKAKAKIEAGQFKDGGTASQKSDEPSMRTDEAIARVADVTINRLQ